MSRPNPNRGETRAEIFIRAFAPCDLTPKWLPIMDSSSQMQSRDDEVNELDGDERCDDATQAIDQQIAA